MSTEKETAAHPRYAAPAAAAAYIAVSQRTIYNWIDSGRLTAYRVGTRVVRVDLNELDALLAPAGGAK